MPNWARMNMLRRGVRSFLGAGALLNPYVVTVPDGGANNANAAELLSAVGPAGLVKGSALVEGEYFQVTDNGDTVDNALQTAKTSAPIGGDKFLVAAGDVTFTYVS